MAATARELMVAAGFSVAESAATKRRRFAGGIKADEVATDASGQQWVVLVAGASTVVPAGLRRSDVLFRALGEASVLTTAGERVLLLTTELPARGSAALAALHAARGTSLVDVVPLGAGGAHERLAVYAAGATEPVGEPLGEA